MSVEDEKEEFEIDAESVKDSMLKYLETFKAAYASNADDLTEMRRIYTQVNADKTALSRLSEKLSNHVSYLENWNTARNEAAFILEEQIKARQ